MQATAGTRTKAHAHRFVFHPFFLRPPASALHSALPYASRADSTPSPVAVVTPAPVEGKGTGVTLSTPGVIHHGHFNPLLFLSFQYLGKPAITALMSFQHQVFATYSLLGGRVLSTPPSYHNPIAPTHDICRKLQQKY